MAKNIKNLTKLRDWLKDGAPHMVFSMNIGLRNVEDLNANYIPDGERSKIERNNTGLGACGTVCCIGGAAFLMKEKALGKADKTTDLGNAGVDWDEIEWAAMENLGLKNVHYDLEGEYGDREEGGYGHPLFDPDMAPRNCTPQQAAQAVQNVIDGHDRDCWSHVS